MQRFHIAVPDGDLADLRQRLALTRWPSGIFEPGDEDGFSLPAQQALIRHWTEEFDWRAQEAALNTLPQFMTTIGEQALHVIHVRGKGRSAMPLVLTHGWPGSFLEFKAMIPLLTDPEAHGGDPQDAFDVVIPSLPGFGFSPAPAQAGTNTETIAGLWADLMSSLGYHRFAAQGGDIGAGVSMWLARRYPERLIGAHLNYIPGSFRPSVDADNPITAGEQAFLDRAAQFSALEGAYAALQSTKPQTLAYALTDSPAGLAAWLAEKFHAWSDQRQGRFSFTTDTLLTNISLYWFTNTLAGSLRLYKENRSHPLHFAPEERCTVPLGVSVFPFELPTPPKSWVERVFDVRHWTEMPRGGHFAALEQPALLVDEIRTFFRPFR